MQFYDPRLPSRIWAHITPEPMSGCWLWTASVHFNGYGQSFLDGKNQKAHRVVYTAARGAVPAGLDLDHLCRVRCCVNPDHLEPVTRSENLRRGNAGDSSIGQRRRAQLALQTMCSRGHDYRIHGDTDANGHRRCLTCRAALARAYYAARKAGG